MLQTMMWLHVTLASRSTLHLLAGKTAGMASDKRRVVICPNHSCMSALSRIGIELHLSRLIQSPQAAPLILQSQHLLPQALQLILSRPCLNLCRHITNVTT